ncbi:SpoIIIAH-like family protein [Bacillus sp. FJAT-47783]|uniref:SpoIIIAH-like family protein n=1 Tax=Bacillus sp. FJAT-47783 TaxID=2922712 RepID=UPI001FAC98EA|nr:SpoIIIAH-like family protein [Bacillus sp. FJAT-47783]
MLKKQTVWLLTMLSLVVVLSVYYITSPDGGMNSNVATISTDQQDAPVDEQKDNPEKDSETPESEPSEEEGQKEDGENKENTTSGESVTETEEGDVISTISSDDLFTAVRMELEDERNERKQELETIIGSKDASAEEKSKAYEEMRQLSAVTTKEKVLETLIKSKGYSDALVQADGEHVRITVKTSSEHSKKQANEIIHLVKSEINTMQDVAVTFKISK